MLHHLSQSENMVSGRTTLTIGGCVTTASP